MKNNLKNKCDLFADNYRELNRGFWWNYSSNNRLGALLYTMNSQKVNVEEIKSCKGIIRNNVGVFSRFKDITFFMTSVILSLQNEPEKVFQDTTSIYKDMKKEGFRSSVYLALAALMIAVQAEPYDYQRIITVSKNFYDAMKRDHRFLTNSSDYSYAVLLAMSDKSVTAATRDMEACYEILSENFFSSNAVQSLSHVLAFGEDAASMKCGRVIELFQAIKNKGYKFGTRLELPVLGTLSLLSENMKELAEDMVEVNQYLKSQKGFRSWSITNKERLMYAAALISQDYAAGMKDKTMELSLTNSITGILLAQQAAMIAASAAAASAASSSAT